MNVFERRAFLPSAKMIAPKRAIITIVEINNAILPLYVNSFCHYRDDVVELLDLLRVVIETFLHTPHEPNHHEYRKAEFAHQRHDIGGRRSTSTVGGVRDGVGEEESEH